MNTSEFCTARGKTMKNFPMKLWSAFVWTFFHTENENAQQTWLFHVVRHTGVWLVLHFRIVICIYEKKTTVNQSRPNFHMISDKPNVSLGIVDCSLYTRRIALKDGYHKKRMDMLAYTPMEFT